MGPLIAPVIFKLTDSFLLTFIAMGSAVLLNFFYLIVGMPNKLNKITNNKNEYDIEILQKTLPSLGVACEGFS